MNFFKRKRDKKRPDSAPVPQLAKLSLSNSLLMLPDSTSSLSAPHSTKHESLMDSILMDFDNLLVAGPEPTETSPAIQPSASSIGSITSGNTYLSYQLHQNKSLSSLPPLSRESSISSGSEEVSESIRSLLNRSTVDDARDIIRIIQRDAVSSTSRGSSSQSPSASLSASATLFTTNNNDPVVSSKLRKNRRYRTDPSLLTDSTPFPKDTGKLSPASGNVSSSTVPITRSTSHQSDFRSSSLLDSPHRPPRSQSTSDFRFPAQAPAHKPRSTPGNMQRNASPDTSPSQSPESTSWLNRQAHRSSTQKIASGRQSSKLPTTASPRRTTTPTIIQLADRSVADDSSDSTTDSSDDDDTPLALQTPQSPVAASPHHINPLLFGSMSLEAQQDFWVRYYQSSVMSQHVLGLQAAANIQAQAQAQARREARSARKAEARKARHAAACTSGVADLLGSK